MATVQMAILIRLWTKSPISSHLHALVLSILRYGSETLTLQAVTERRVHALN
ncbi:hypothetical protein DPMN_155665 [Dreissena polymorpha]|uniref:Uncharacterized protein n=1 Tax=Dreissena polymorpha TaxID=45954 RepID=A0A9D4FS55_DREPO|nr:hypothetical protein DPMN_155651 [Dreissena polymorpha]KAH3801999.1 hypothetical protein DPMN_155665 [Dreissena polymorpha]